MSVPKGDQLKYVPIDEIPEYKWAGVFEMIPKGKALVLDFPEYNPKTVRGALHHHQKRHGKFLDYLVLFRGGETKKIYIMHKEKQP